MDTPHFSNDEAIIIKGARVHNLKALDTILPRDQLIVLTGPSGSGKSSLAFDTIYAEGQRRYVESLSTYARQFLEQLEKPDVDSISGLSPTISIVQKTTSYNPRSTVGTVTEIYDFLRLLFARIGQPYCWKCGEKIQAQSQQAIVDQIMAAREGTKLAILSPIVRGRKGEYQKELYQLRQKGFVRIRIDGELRDLSEEIQLDRNKKHHIEVYIDRVVMKNDRETLESRISDSVELALKMGQGLLILQNLSDKTETLFSEKFACTSCGISYPDPEPRTFSFNSPLGACSKCDGLGLDPEWEIDLEEEEDISLQEIVCPECEGARLKKESLHFKITDQNIAQVSNLSILDAGEFFKKLKLTDRQKLIAEKILKEISDRLDFLRRVGVDYLSLSRSARTLSGGEAQRIRLATQIGSSLVGVIYVLDEPSIGLHPRDHHRLLDTLERLRDLGNTVLVVEHDRDTIEKADFVVDLGPGAGKLGGSITAAGSLQEISKNPKSLTGQYLSGKLKIETPKHRREWEPSETITIQGAHKNNLKNISVQFPLGVFTCVTGVSGSGKSTLVIDTLYRLLLESVYQIDPGDLKIEGSQGLQLIDKVVDINQKPIGRTPRSNPATYAGLFSMIRDLFASLPESQVRGFKAGRFSFNVKGGRCETCEGGGMKKVEMHFLPNVFVTCDICQGKRYNRDTLEIKYKGKNISEVLNMTAAEGLEFFDAVPNLKHRLKVINDVGLGYIHLGQSATTLSGGEAQRIKLAKELSKRSTGKTVYILDEPTTGLHFHDIKKLLQILEKLVDQGNTVVVIEHNLDFIKVADHIIDIGPEGGAKGGEVVAVGTPEEIVQNKKSHTGRFLKDYL